MVTVCIWHVVAICMAFMAIGLFGGFTIARAK